MSIKQKDTAQGKHGSLPNLRPSDTVVSAALRQTLDDIALELRNIDGSVQLTMSNGEINSLVKKYIGSKPHKCPHCLRRFKSKMGKRIHMGLKHDKKHSRL